ncbi:MAG: NAD-dependent epimerase/dehydratase family protein [Actinomycetota bacterium]|nr:NAD-dependent epimerase/dehydratase family protein [Actinomycetota bacterium]
MRRSLVRAAALRGIHADKYTADDFRNLNGGTRNVYEAARECGVPKVLLCSTRGIYGRTTGGSQASRTLPRTFL